MQQEKLQPPEGSWHPHQRQRPLGVKIIAALVGIQGLLEVIVGLLILFALGSISQAVRGHGHITTSRIVDIFGYGLGGTSLLIGLLTLIFVWGLWMLKRWAYWTTIGFSVLILIRQGIEFIRPHNSTATIIGGMIIPVIVLVYFLLFPQVRRAFRI